MEGEVLTLLTAATAANNPPTTSSQGVARPTGQPQAKAADLILVLSRTSGTATFQFNLWGYQSQIGEWADEIVTTGTITITADKSVTKLVLDFDRFSRYYLELVAVTGTGASADGYLQFNPGM